ncbi:MAG TPA: cobalt ABC transporter ATP-binding protein [Ruminococcaceae bacterium]|nr:cobalt ABC transporter ATP-binding protein [Oscillospiraceae bacterium]
MDKTILSVNNVSYMYPDGFMAIRNISFQVQNGSTVGIIGSNGAGKSTLIKLITGLINAENGEIFVDGIKVSRKSLNQIRQKIGVVFQNPDNQLFMPTVYEDAAFAPRNFGMTEQQVEAAVNSSLEQMGIAHLRNKAPFKLSGGEKRAAAIAGVLAYSPELLIMDEPTAELDPKARRRFITMAQSLKMTKIIASHDLDMVYDLCDKIIIICDGNKFAEGGKELLTDNELMQSCNLEMPLAFQKISDNN